MSFSFWSYHPSLLEPGQGKADCAWLILVFWSLVKIFLTVSPVGTPWFNYQLSFHNGKRIPYQALNIVSFKIGLIQSVHTCRLEHNIPGKYHIRIVPSESTTTHGSATNSSSSGGNNSIISASNASFQPQHRLFRRRNSATYSWTVQFIVSKPCLVK